MKCYICEAKDSKDNMVKGDINYQSMNAILNVISAGVIPEKYHYFHRQCLQDVVCEPDDYTKEQVERALECHDFLLREERVRLRKLERQEREAKLLKSRITLARSTLECLK